MKTEELKGYLEQIERADIASDSEFQSILINSELILGISDSDLADELMVTRPTINRWRSGKNSPHMFMRDGIYKYLKKRTKKLIRKREEYGGSGSGGQEPMSASGPTTSHHKMVAKPR